MAAPLGSLGPSVKDLMVEASQVVEMVDDYISRSAHRADSYCWLNSTADQTHSGERFAADRNASGSVYRRTDSRPNRSANGRANRRANRRADCCPHCSSDAAPNRAPDASPNRTAREPLRRAAEPVELQLLRRRLYLRGAIQLLRLLQLHPVVLAVDQRLRRTMR